MSHGVKAKSKPTGIVYFKVTTEQQHKGWLNARFPNPPRGWNISGVMSGKDMLDTLESAYHTCLQYKGKSCANDDPTDIYNVDHA